MKKVTKKITLRAEVIGRMGLIDVVGGAGTTAFCPATGTCSAECITVNACTRLDCETAACSGRTC